MLDQETRYEFGYKELGPVVADYLSRLQAHILAFEREHNAQILFVSRAGVRIRRALEVFLSATGLPGPSSPDFFWISRLLVAKGVWNRSRAATVDLLTKEFRGAKLSDFVSAMFRFSTRRVKLNPTDIPPDATGADIPKFLNGDSKSAEVVRAFFENQSMLFEAYVDHLVGPKRTALLVDTGWQGTAQTLLAKAFPEYSWWGGYFARFGSTDTDRTQWANMIGLVFESDIYDPKSPETSVVLHRHLIESLFEPSGRSIEWLAQTDREQVVAPDSRAVLADAPKKDTDPIYCGVLKYLEDLPKGPVLADIRRNAAQAWQRLATMIVHPTADQLRLADGISRSADFGREIKVPILLPASPRFNGDTANLRIQQSLWPCGQVAVEYPAAMAEALQKRLAGGSPRQSSAPIVKQSLFAREVPAVAVITRTMDRPMFLERALHSVASQTLSDYVHVVVSDGGDISRTKEAIERSNCDHSRVVLIDGVANRGMEAASNLAINNCESDYIVIHDDDDSWEPDFLKKTVAFMEGPSGRLYGGVITKSTYCSEEVTPTGIEIHGRSPYHGWVENVHLMEMAIGNFFPPIAFLFRRSIWAKIGGYNESFPVLGDWDFNLRFLVEADIGVIAESLANYHHRDRGDVTTFGNSVIANRDKHLEFASIVRNSFVRDMVERGQSAAATLAGLGLYLADQRDRLRSAENRLVQINQDAASLRSSVASTNSSPWGDTYWLAFQSLLRKVAENNPAVMSKIKASAAGDTSPAGMLALVRQAWPAKSKETQSAGPLGRVAQDLLKEAAELSTIGAPMIAPDFDEAAYLRLYPDVAKAVREGSLSSGYDHYVRYGRVEGRTRPRLH